MKNVILSIDLGTMGVKLALVDTTGKILKSAYSEYPIIAKETGQAEQDQLEWWKGILANLNELRTWDKSFAERLIAISLCGQMHTHVYLDSNDEPLGNALTWMDQRSSGIIDGWNSNGIADELFDLTWNAPTTTYTAPQVCWTKANRPELYAKTRSVLIAKDYIKFLLTGEKVTDHSDASGTSLFDIRKNQWSDEAFKLVGIEKNIFPRVAPSTTIIGGVSSEASKITGLPEGLPVINGGSDHSIAEIGSGLLKEGKVSGIVGTAGVVAACSAKPVKDDKRRVICWSYPLEGYWDILGITQTAASSLTWFRNTFDKEAGDGIFEEYSNLAAEVEPGSNGLIFLPYLMGERTPHWDSHAKGLFFGLKMSHTKANMIRAIMEGVAYSLKECIEIFADLGVNSDSICVMGGGSKSQVWRQIQSDIFNKKVLTLETQDTGSVGNMIIASLGLGVIKTPEDAAKIISVNGEQSPLKDNNDVYEKNYLIYKELYRRNKDLFKKMED